MRQVKIDHPIYGLLKEIIRESTEVILLADNPEVKIKILKIGADCYDMATANGSRSKGIKFLNNGKRVKITAEDTEGTGLKKCVEEDLKVYLDSFSPLIRQNRVIRRS